MTLDEYQRLAARTMTSERGAMNRNGVCGDALGLAGEAGEVTDLLKKHLFHGHELDRAKLAAELGDVLWYVSALATHLGVDLSDVAAGNIAKLQARYPQGFNEADSIARRDVVFVRLSDFSASLRY
jgi:NTP pyrophosphatase (non-canonical NTP hydrolase)